jgi:hypothetical protein
MQRARRVAFVAALAVLGVVSLAGCRTEPSVAAYVGGTKITEDRVERIVNEVKPVLPKVALSDIREAVVRWIVVGEVADRLAHERGYPVEPANLEDLASQLPVHVNGSKEPTELAKVYGKWLAAARAVIQKVQPARLTDDDRRAIFDQAVADGKVPPNATYEQVSPQLDTLGYEQFVGLRDELLDAAKRAHLSVNPKYRPLVMTFGPSPDLPELKLPLGAGADAA